LAAQEYLYSENPATIFAGFSVDCEESAIKSFRPKCAGGFSVTFWIGFPEPSHRRRHWTQNQTSLLGGSGDGLSFVLAVTGYAGHHLPPSFFEAFPVIGPDDSSGDRWFIGFI
jgi:hypothetical protein